MRLNKSNFYLIIVMQSSGIPSIKFNIKLKHHQNKKNYMNIEIMFINYKLVTNKKITVLFFVMAQYLV